MKGEGVAGLPDHLHLDVHLALQGEVVRDDEGDQGEGVPHRSHIPWQPAAVVLSQKIESANPAQLSYKRANPRYFIMLYGISCEFAGCVHCTPAYRGLRVHDSRLRPNQTLVSYTLAGLAQISRLSSVSLKLQPLNTGEADVNAQII